MLTAVQIDQRILAAAEGKVVKGNVYARLVDAKACVNRALAYSERIRAESHAEIEQACQLGYEDGERRAREEFAAQMATTVMRMESAYMGLEARLVNTVMNALQTILGSMDEKFVLERLIRQTIRAAGQEKKLSLRVAAEQFAEANQIMASILVDYPHVEFVDVVKDPNMPRDGCVLESEFGAVDGSLNAHLATIRQSLISVFAGKREQAAVSSNAPYRKNIG